MSMDQVIFIKVIIISIDILKVINPPIPSHLLWLPVGEHSLLFSLLGQSHSGPETGRTFLTQHFCPLALSNSSIHQIIGKLGQGAQNYRILLLYWKWEYNSKLEKQLGVFQIKFLAIYWTNIFIFFVFKQPWCCQCYLNDNEFRVWGWHWKRNI